MVQLAVNDESRCSGFPVQPSLSCYRYKFSRRSSSSSLSFDFLEGLRKHPLMGLNCTLKLHQPLLSCIEKKPNKVYLHLSSAMTNQPQQIIMFIIVCHKFNWDLMSPRLSVRTYLHLQTPHLLIMHSDHPGPNEVRLPSSSQLLIYNKFFCHW